jgi:hypothetical protein
VGKGAVNIAELAKGKAERRAHVVPAQATVGTAHAKRAPFAQPYDRRGERFSPWTEKYVHVIVAVDDGSLPASLSP